MKPIVDYSSLSEILIERSSENLGITFINGDQDNILSYRDLYKRAKKILYKLQQLGIKVSDELLFQIDDNQTFVEFFWACILGKLIPVPVNIANNEEGVNKINNVYKILTKPTLITSQNHYKKIKSKLDKTCSIFFTEAFEECYNDVGEPLLPSIEPSDIAFIQFSSGSTGIPKGVVLTHKNLMANIDGIKNGAKHTLDDIFLGWMPLTHDMGLIGFHLTPLAINVNQYNIPTDLFIRKPMIWIKKASQYKTTCLSSPNFGYHYTLKFFKTDEAEGLDLSNVRLIYNGAEPISAQLCHEFLNFMAKYGLKRNTMLTVYGLAEASVGVAFPNVEEEFETIYVNRHHLNFGEDIVIRDKSDNDAIPLVVEGKAIDHCKLKIGNKKGDEVGEKHIGLIYIKGENVTTRYYNNEQATKELITPDGWVNTGDLGLIYNGKLVVTGRAKEIIFVGGQNYYPYDIERTVESIDEIELGKVVAIGSWSEQKAKEELIIFYLYRKNNYDEFLEIAQQIKDIVYKNMGLYVEYVLPIKQVPKTTSGKIKRTSLKQAYENGEFAKLINTLYNNTLAKKNDATSESSNILKKKFSNDIVALVSKAFLLDVDKININDSLSGQNLSSLGIINFTSNLNETFRFNYSPQILFEHKTINSLIDQIIKEQIETLISFYDVKIDKQENKSISVNNKTTSEQTITNILLDNENTDIAIVGIAGIFPNAQDIESFWTLLSNSECAITEVPSDRWCWEKYNTGKDHSGKWGGFINNYDKFDPLFFNISPKEATIMDPQHRLMLETAWCALEDAGIKPSSLSDTNTGVFVGVSTHDYESFIDEDKLEIDENYGIGLAQAMLSNRLSYFLNIHGPSISFDTACSSSLVALHEAVKSIHAGECEQAIVGGVNLLLSPIQYSTLQKAGFLSKEGKCKAFCDSSDGYVRGEGVCAVIIKPLNQALKDNNQVYARIKGSSINHGGMANSLTAPNPNAQADLLIKAYKNAKLNINHVTYIEAHGTGTKLGDPIEISGLKKAFYELNVDKQNCNYCGIGSVKSNIGHLEAAAGLAGLIKVLLSIRQNTLPPTVNFKKLNSYINLDKSPFFIVDKPVAWNRIKDESNNEIPRIAGISSFGFGGTNAHVIVQEYSSPYPVEIEETQRVFCFSAKNKTALYQYLKKFLLFLNNIKAEKCTNFLLARIAFTLQLGREDMTERKVFIAKTFQELKSKLDEFLNSQNVETPLFTNTTNSDITRIFGNAIVKESIEKAIQQNDILSLAELWSYGASIDWSHLYINENLTFCSLPTYAFQKNKYHISSLYNHNNSIVNKEQKWSSEFKDRDNIVISDSQQEILTNIYGIIQNSLGIEVNANDNFYAKGGSSINAARIVSQINDKYSTQIQISKLLSLGSIHEFVTYVLNYIEENSNAIIKPVAVSSADNNKKNANNKTVGDQLWMLSSDQERLWMLCKINSKNPAFNIPVAFTVHQSLRLDKLYESYNLLLEKHSIVKGKIEEVNHTPVLRVYENIDYKILIDEISESEIQSKIKYEAGIPFNIQKDPLIRLKVFRLKNEKFIIFINIHHIISDIWSIGLFAKELIDYYFALLNNSEVKIEKTSIDFNEFVSIKNKLIEHNQKKQITFWKETLADCPIQLNLPYDFERPEIQKYDVDHLSFFFSDEKIEALKQLALSNKTTLFIILLSAFKSTLSLTCNQNDLIIGCPIANRDIPGTESMVGFFANTLVLRNNILYNDNFVETVNTIKTNFLKAIDNSNIPYFKIVEAIAPKRHGTYNPLFQVMFSMVSLPDFSGDTHNQVERLDVFSGYNDYDIFLRIEQEGHTLKGTLDYALSLFSKDKAELIQNNFLSLIDQVIINPQIVLSEIKIVKKDNSKDDDGIKQNIIISSTFSDQPLKKPVEFWANLLNVKANVRLADYNQVFNELLGNFSMSQNTSGVNILLIRIDDWVKFSTEADDINEIAKKITTEFISGLLSASDRFSVPVFLGMLPSDSSNSRLSQDLIKELEDKILLATSENPNIHIFNHKKITNHYPVDRIFDKITDKQGHVPYTEAYFTALGTTIIRMLYSLKRSPFKVIVLDCDNTLWKGIIAEDGVENIIIDHTRLEFQKCLVKQQESGLLLCLCSKNEEHDVLNVFDKHKEIMPLKLEHIISWRINWNTKSQNIKELSEELNLGLDSFIFIDDNPIECADVSANMPEVLSIQFPNDDNDKINNLIKHGWFFDHLNITQEDKSRSNLYKDELMRTKESQKFMSYFDFIKNLELKVKIPELNDEDVNRITQLTQRTNQLNNTTIRRTDSEIGKMIGNQSTSCYTVRVTDKFGSYGLVGAIILSFDKANYVYVDSFILSCRVIGKGVEHAMLNKIGEIAKGRNIHEIQFPYISSNRNTPILDFLNSIKSSRFEKTENGLDFYFSADYAAMLKFEPSDNKLNIIKNGASKTKGRFESPILLKIIESYNNVEDIQKIISGKNNNAKLQVNENVGANTYTSSEELIIHHIEELINVNAININDNFFDLGLNSIQLIQLVSKIQDKVTVNLEGIDLFKYPTVKTLAAYLMQNGKSGSKFERVRQRATKYQENLKNLSK